MFQPQCRGQGYPGALWSGPNGLGEAPTVAKTFCEDPWFPITLAMADLLWQRGNASGGWQLVSQASHRGVAERLAPVNLDLIFSRVFCLQTLSPLRPYTREIF